MSPSQIDTRIEVAGSNGLASSNQLSGSSLLAEFIRRHTKVQFVRLQWQDHSGLVRARIVPLEHALSIAAGKRKLHVPPIAFHCVVDNDLLPDFDPTGNHWLVPDWTSLYTRSTLDPLYASVMCQVYEVAPSRPQPTWKLCPRFALEKVTAQAAELFGIDFLVGFEVEFEILKPPTTTNHSITTTNTNTSTLVPASSGFGHFSVGGLRDPCYEYVEEAVLALQAAGVRIDAFQTEGVRGQYEIALGCLPPAAAVDQLILTQDTLKRVFGRHGLVATMSPRPVKAREQFTGQHTHISINPPSRFQDGCLQDAFLAGMLRRLPALCAFCLPFPISYERVQPRLAGHLVSWGTENRLVPVRKIKQGHWELRFVDATANMYLALSALFSAGLLGCINKEPLLWPDMASITDPWSEDAEHLPTNLEKALSELGDVRDELGSVMGQDLVEHYLRIKRAEVETLRGMDMEEARQLFNELF